MRALIAAAVSVLALLGAPGHAADLPVARMEKVIAEQAQNNLFMGAVLVTKGDTVILDKAYGTANLELKVPNTTQTKFRIGSVTKQFTAAAILLLEERGKLKTSDLLKSYLPDIPAAWDKVTILHLLTHTSGIFNYTSLPEMGEFKRRKLSPSQVADLVKDKPLEFSPGERHKYSNTGYVVLGEVIEKASGQSYAQFLQTQIFDPLGLKNTGYEDQSVILAGRAAGYERRDGKLINSSFIDMSVPFSAGALYSTTHDLLAWENALFAGKLISPSSLQKMITPFKDGYGYGLIINSIDGHKRIQHFGGIDGFSSALSRYPDDQLTIIVLNNVGNGATGVLASHLESVAFGKPVTLTSERKEVAVDAKLLARYVGRYEIAPNVVLDVTQDGNSLFTQMGKQPRLQLYAESTTKFFTRAIDAQVSFADGEGPAPSLTLHQGDRAIPAKRVP